MTFAAIALVAVWVMAVTAAIGAILIANAPYGSDEGVKTVFFMFILYCLAFAVALPFTLFSIFGLPA